MSSGLLVVSLIGSVAPLESVQDEGAGSVLFEGTFNASNDCGDIVAVKERLNPVT
jgi:hypothetical protein